MVEFLKHILTCSDNTTWSMSKLVALGTALTMNYNFVAGAGHDYQGYALGVAAIIASLAAKTYVEKP